MKMREININIEGYNVNGICVRCLNYNRKMDHRDELGDFLKLLCNIEVPSGILLQICWECQAYLANVMKFQKQILKSYDALLEYSRQQTFLNCPTDFARFATSRLSVSKLNTNNIHAQKDSIKVENDNDNLGNKNGFKSEAEDFDDEDVDVASGGKADIEKRDYEEASAHEDPIKDETDSSDVLINILPNGKRKKLMPSKRKKKLKKRRCSKDESDQLKSAITTIELAEVDLQKERQQLSNNEEFKNEAFKCQNCLISFKSKEGLDRHNLANHDTTEGYFCTICSSVLSNRKLFKDHNKRHFKRYECVLCGKRWRLDGDEVVNSKELQAHVNNDHCCEVCGEVYYTKEEQRKHASHKSRIKCPLCDRTFSHRAGLMNHRMAMHEAKVDYTCATCQKKFRWKNSLKRHMEKHDQKTSEQSPAAYCETCRISFNYICSYQRHLRNSLKHVTHDQLRFICDHCNRKFADKTKLRYHIEEKHLHKTYLCDICFKPSKNRSHLEQHIRNVHIGRPNNKMCNHCGKGFPTKVQLECHIRTHTGERPFICEYCPTTFTQQSNLYKHKRQVHLNIKSKRYPTQKKKKEDINQPVANQYQMTWT